jgi:lipopolysaccharide transport system ATP-binding protein
MSDRAVLVEGISKRYFIGHRIERYKTLRDTLAAAAKKPVHKVLNLLRGRPAVVADLGEEIWALQGVSFEIRQGEIVGIIGRNGAGKSTLLKVLSRITEPTGGYALIQGRVGSLLEVGTGFHFELTGRENIFLNGAILGMKKAEIERKFDEIVAFSEVERFIDTPIKHYSSGMYLRLAFAVAAHLEPEILMVDEVLAVGDAQFQKKCLNKMQDVGREGRTVLFVSHNMPAITRLCDRTILLEDGKVFKDGPSHEVVSAYLNSGLGTTAARQWDDPDNAPATDVVRLRAARVRSKDHQITDVVDIRNPIGIEMEYEVLKPGYLIHPHFTLYNEDGVHICSVQDVDPAWRGRERPPGRYISTGWIPGNLLNDGTIFVGPAIRTLNPNHLHIWERDAIAFMVVDSFESDSSRGDNPCGRIPGAVRPLMQWTTQVVSYYDQG